MEAARQITFRELYAEYREQPTPAQAFVAEVARITRRSPTTVTAWCRGQQVPEPLAQERIASHFGVDIDTLFPSTKKEASCQ